MDGVCLQDEVEGCTDNGSINGFNQVNDLDGDGLLQSITIQTMMMNHVLHKFYGCTDSDYLEYWSYDPDLGFSNSFSYYL